MYQYQPLDRASQAQLAQQLGHRDEHDLEGDKHRKQQSAKYQRSTAHLELRQHITVKRSDQRGKKYRRYHHQKRVHEIGTQARGLHADLRFTPGLQPGLDGGVQRQANQVAAPDFVQRLDGVDHHHINRQQKHQRQKRQHHIKQHPLHKVGRAAVHDGVFSRNSLRT